MRSVNSITLCIVFIFMSLSALSQYGDPNGVTDSSHRSTRLEGSRFLFGGNFSCWVGSITYIEIAPVVGYRITSRFSSGGGPVYMYYNEQGLYEQSIYGVKEFLSFTLLKNTETKSNIRMPFQNLFLYAENQVLNIQPLYYNPTSGIIKGQRIWIDIPMVGIGLRYAITDRAGISLLVLWDISGNRHSPYSNPEIRIGVEF